MNQYKSYFNKFHYKKKSEYSFAEILLWLLLKPVSVVYTCITKFRIWLYSKQILKSQHPGVKVISIGNLTTGGTGKTPFVYELSRYLASINSYKMAILSRGYGRKLNRQQKINIVKANNKIIPKSPDECGDEAFMLAHLLDNVTILTGGKRYLLAKEAVDNYNCNLIILDDGFQHLALKRDLNIVLIDAEKIFGNNQLLPLGPLREPISSLIRADAIVMVTKNPSGVLDFAEPEFITRLNIPIFNAQYKFDCFQELTNQEIIHNLPYKVVLAVAGIAQPQYLINQLEELKLSVSDKVFFNDHKNYSENDIFEINKIGLKAGAEAIITTEKDAVKILPFLSLIHLPVYAIKMRMDISISEMLEKLNFNNQ